MKNVLKNGQVDTKCPFFRNFSYLLNQIFLSFTIHAEYSEHDLARYCF